MLHSLAHHPSDGVPLIVMPVLHILAPQKHRRVLRRHWRQRSQMKPCSVVSSTIAETLNRLPHASNKSRRHSSMQALLSVVLRTLPEDARVRWYARFLKNAGITGHIAALEAMWKSLCWMSEEKTLLARMMGFRHIRRICDCIG